MTVMQTAARRASQALLSVIRPGSHQRSSDFAAVNEHDELPEEW